MKPRAKSYNFGIEKTFLNQKACAKGMSAIIIFIY